MGGPVRQIFDALTETLDFECNHPTAHPRDDKGNPRCEQVTLTGLEAAANRIYELIEKGELP